MFHWYVINTYSGHENKVKANLEHRIVSMNQQPAFRRVVVFAQRCQKGTSVCCRGNAAMQRSTATNRD
jgi:transcription antitermination factor NusG